jgi:3-oxoadipate enol-lactonase
MDDAGIDRAVVCGCSMGGYVSFELWRRARDRLGGVILADTRAVADTPEAAEARRVLARRVLAEGSGFLVEDPPPLLSEHAGDELRAWVRRVMAEQSPEAIAAAALGMAERPDSTPDLADIDVPALVIAGADDALIAPEVSVSMGKAIPGAVIEMIPRAGHLANLEGPEEFDLMVAVHLVRCGVLER